MKRNIFIIAFLIFILLSFLFPTATFADSYEAGYYIKDYHVDIVANDDRSFDITETIDVFFTEPRRGIYRNIDLYGAAETFWFSEEGVNVEGAPFEDEGFGDIKIGDPDVEIEGDKRYVISYTLMSYAENDKTADYLYLDIIGTNWDTEIKNFSATIALPETAVVEQYKITGGYYGIQRDLSSVTVEEEQNVFSISSSQPLPPYNGVTINVEMNEGAYKNATPYIPPYTINSIDRVLVIDPSLKFSGGDIIAITKNTDEQPLLNLLPELISEVDGFPDYLKINNYRVTSGDVSLNSDNRLILPDSMKKGDRIEFTVSYDIQLFATSVNPVEEIDYILLNSSLNYNVQDISFRFIAPFNVAIAAVEHQDNYQITGNNSDEVFIEYETSSIGSEPVEVVLMFDEGRLIAPLSWVEYLFIGLCLAIVLGLFVFVIKTRNPPLVTPTEYYPPDDLDPAMLGCILRGKANKKDITTLIYYWAAKGFLKIEFKKAKKFTLYKLKPLDDNHKDYEKDLFELIFNEGDQNKVDSKDLNKSMYQFLDSATKDIQKFFKNEKPLTEKRYNDISNLYILGGVFGVIALSLIMSAIKGVPLLDIGITWFSFLFPLLFFTVGLERILNARYRQTISNIIINIFTVFVLLISCFLFYYLMVLFYSPIISACMFIACLLIIVLGLNIPKRTPYGHEMLGRTLGFKRFLKTAKQQQLETLISENPSYYYDILPYAHVLGVSKVWQNKIDIFSEPPKTPDWVDYSEIGKDVAFGAVMTTGLYSIGRSLENHSGYSSSGGSSGGGGSSYSGGGYSGGGGGGGGGSSW